MSGATVAIGISFGSIQVYLPRATASWYCLNSLVILKQNRFPKMPQTVPTSFVRAYLRASTSEQDAPRAPSSIDTFATERGLAICNYYIENELGSRLERPELFRLLKDCRQRDILLIEDVDRLSRLPGMTGSHSRK